LVPVILIAFPGAHHQPDVEVAVVVGIPAIGDAAEQGKLELSSAGSELRTQQDLILLRKLVVLGVGRV